MKKIYLWLVLFLSISSPTLAEASDIPIQKLYLHFDDRRLTLDFKAHPDLITTDYQHYITWQDTRIPIDLDGVLVPTHMQDQIQADFFYAVSEEKLRNYLDETTLLRDRQNNTIQIMLDDKENIVIEGQPESGFRVDYDQLVSLINQAITDKHPHIRVPAERIYSRVIADERLIQRGIKDVIAIGESNFTGSSKARRQNIRAAARKFNNIVIPRGKRFSFNDILEDVDEEDGFVKELVIKGNKTEKELGGGVCQVSTTAFRAAFNGGFPITDRRNHSYAVPYYKPFGLDAAIYLGALDMRFKNNTPGDLLIQTIIEGDDLKFVFYGTSDDRQIITEGPFISKYRDAPEAIVLDSEDIPAGQTKIVSDAHDGFVTEWKRVVRFANGNTDEQTFTSTYRPWPARILRGVEPEQTKFVPAPVNKPLRNPERNYPWEF